MKKLEKVPENIAIIPDGNRRWAKSHRLSFLQGYTKGVKKFIEFSEWCMQYGIRSITVWALSTENVKRPKEEVETLFNIYRRAAKDKSIIKRLHETKTRFVVVGKKTLLPKDLIALLKKVEDGTRKYKDRIIYLLLGYGGREDIIYAANQIAKESRKGKIKKVEDETFKRYMLSKDVPDIDFVIRTSGEERLSGFMPWQAGYAELYFCKKYWPEFEKKDLEKALAEYSRRERRFGK
ncbi:MAG: polyprenyl diphosphate synthase [Candidatus Micrarchaeia archaeon]|jgi:undecaprenyl diphosphate synthase